MMFFFIVKSPLKLPTGAWAAPPEQEGEGAVGWLSQSPKEEGRRLESLWGRLPASAAPTAVV